MAHQEPDEAKDFDSLKRRLHLADLRVLLAQPSLSEWGMASLKDTLSAIVPELEQSTMRT